MNDGAAVVLGYFYSGVCGAGCGSSDEEGELHLTAFHFLSHGDHFIERWGNKTGETDDVCLLLDSGIENFITRNHHSHIDDFKAIAGEYDTDDVLSNVMHVTFDGGHDDATRGHGFLDLDSSIGIGDIRLSFLEDFDIGKDFDLLFLLHKWFEIGHGFFHHAGGLDHLREKHFTGSKEISYHGHTVHEWAFDDVQWLVVFLARFLGVFSDKGIDTFEQRVLKAFLNTGITPLQVFFLSGFFDAFEFFREV